MDNNEADQQKSRIVALFDRASSTYDQVGPRFFETFGRRLVETARISPGQAVLDIACGRGASLIPAADLVGAGGHVTGIDLAEGMVNAVAHLAQVQGLAQVDVQRMDAERLLFADASFDRVLAGFCLFFFLHPEAALAEIHRVLKPGGLLAASTWAEPEDRWGWLEDLVKQSLLPPPPEPPKPGSAPEPDFETPQGMRAVLEAAGFADIQVLQETREFLYASPEEWWATQWSHGARSILERIEAKHGAQGLADFQDQVFAHLRLLQRPDGIHHTMAVLYSLGVKNPSIAP